MDPSNFERIEQGRAPQRDAGVARIRRRPIVERAGVANPSH
jgi:hypothetical protein